ncbi:MAG: SDR family NAD(P)-dependent oxidoreductase [Opitutaceae bacterium]|nr:SDR family NAD(P)-dependent oxidoreductase [Opitutaceae bacterium]
MPSLSEALQPFSAVLLTGGSSGIGKSFIQLCGNLKPELRICNLSRHAPDKKILPGAPENLNHFSCDVSRFADVARAAGEVQAYLARQAPTGRVLLVNNSGAGSFGAFADLPLDRELAMIDLNVRGLVQLTGLLLPTLLARGGAVMNIASTVAYVPAPFAATYGATKAFVLHWTLALDEELRGSAVRAIAVCPGTTATGFFTAAGAVGNVLGSRLTLTPDAVARSALRALARGRGHVVPGFWNNVYTLVAARLPKAVAARAAARVFARRRALPAAT